MFRYIFSNYMFLLPLRILIHAHNYDSMSLLFSKTYTKVFVFYVNIIFYVVSYFNVYYLLVFPLFSSVYLWRWSMLWSERQIKEKNKQQEFSLPWKW